MATNNPTVGTIPCPYHQVPTTANVKLSEKKGRLYVHCLSCGLNQPTLPPFQDYIKRNAIFDREYQHLYGDGSKYEGGGEPERNTSSDRGQGAPQKGKPGTGETVPVHQEKETPATKTEPETEPQQVKKSGLLARVGRALLEEE